MKKVKKIFLMVSILISMLFIIDHTYAASSASISVSSSSPKKGSPVTITVTVSHVNTVDLTATVSGAGTNSTIRLVDGSMTGEAKDFSKSVTVKPTSTGVISVNISQDSNAVLNGKYVTVTGSRKITVTESSSNNNSKPSNNGNSNSGSNNSNNTNNTNSNNNSNNIDDNKSKDNNLASLSISRGKLSPEFVANKTSYLVNLTSDIEKISINAKAKDSKASVSGTGEKVLKMGSQVFEIVVKAENGSKKTYAITVDVTEKPTAFAELDGKKLGVLTYLGKIEGPAGYKGTNVTIDGVTTTGWMSDKTGLTLVYLMDEEGNKNFYIYENGKVTRKYEKITILGKEYVLLDVPTDMEKQVGLKFTTIKIGDIEIKGWTFNDKSHANYSVVYLMNDAGEKSLYSYEGIEGTLQKYVSNEIAKQDNTLMYVFIGTTVAFAVSTAALAYLYLSYRKKSISAIKDYYDKKNQG